MAFFLMLLLMVMLMAWSYDSATTTDKVAVTEMLFEINIKYQQPSTQHKTHIAHTRHMKLASYMLHNVLTHCFIWLVDNKYYSRQRMNIKRVNNFTMSLIQMVCLSASRIAYISLIWSDAPGCRTTYNVQNGHMRLKAFTITMQFLCDVNGGWQFDWRPLTLITDFTTTV